LINFFFFFFFHPQDDRGEKKGSYLFLYFFNPLNSLLSIDEKKRENEGVQKYRNEENLKKKILRISVTKKRENKMVTIIFEQEEKVQKMVNYFTLPS